MNLLKKDYISIPLIIIGIFLLLISIVAPIGVKIDNEFDLLIKSNKYKQSNYIIYRYNSDCSCQVSGYFIKNKKSKVYYSNKFKYKKLDENAIKFCVMDKESIVILFNQLNR